MFLLAGIIFLTITRCYASSSCQGDISSAEYNALESLFTSTNGLSWKWNTKLPHSTRWRFPSDLSAPCTSMWQGLNCSYFGTGCAITSLFLSDYNLVGSLPKDIGDLSNIQSLQCDHNKLSGHLPDQLELLVFLVDLDLSINSFVGTITSSIGKLVSLRKLNLGHNRFTGFLPTALAQMTSLVLLHLSSNCLTGSLATELGKLTSLIEIGLNNNNLTGSLPTELCQLTSLALLGLNRNSLTGSLPTELGQMTKLRLLDLFTNSLQGSLPTEMGNLRLLTLVYLHDNSLTGLLPTEMGQMTSLIVLDMFRNSLQGSLPTEMGQLSLLTEIGLNSNSLTGSLPTELCQLTSLALLGLDRNSLTGSLPTELGQMTKLRQLYLFSNTLQGSLPTELGQMTKLRVVDLFNNSLQGSLPTEMGNLRLLTFVYLNSNSLTGSLPTEMGQMTSLIVLDMFRNSLHGSLPTEMGQLSLLTELDLNSNSLTGSLPTELGQLTKLIQMDLFSNSLEGSLPTELGNLSSMRVLGLHNNCLYNSLPTELGQLTSLTILYLNNNYLIGTFPIALCQLTSLRVLYLYSNSFTGSLPLELKLLSKLQGLFLYSNSFSGSIPIGVSEITTLLGLDLHNNYLSGSLPGNMSFPQSLLSVDVSTNFLSGSIPSMSSQLENFNVSFNIFTGNLNVLFNNSGATKQLALLDVSHNLLSGPLPSQWSNVTFPILQTLLLSSNCFTGTITQSLMQIPNLQNLILDAYGSAPRCTIPVFGWLSWLVKGQFSKRGTNTGYLPPEILQMPNLITLHAAGNALTGILPELPMNSNLVDVSLANNNIQGSLPKSWQLHGRFIQLDLSSNKLSGVLSGNLSVPLTNASVALPNGTVTTNVFDLSVNRFSGKIPESLYTAEGVNMLDGNLFQCQKSHMPEHDMNSKVAVCGSSAMNVSLYSWLGTFVLLLCIVFLLRSQLQGVIWGVYRCEISPPSGVISFLNGVQLFGQVCVGSSMIGVVVLLIAYLSMKDGNSSGYSTHTYQYGWLITVAYMHGVLPSVVVIISVCGSCVMIYLAISHQTNGVLSEPVIKSRWSIFEWLKTCAILLCHMVVTVALNVLYVIVILAGLPSAQLTLLQGALGGFKLFWNSAYIGWSLNRLPFLNASGRLQISSAMKIFTFLVSPYVATLFSDSTCFLYIIYGSPVVSASFAAKTFNCNAQCSENFCVDICGMSSISVISTSTSPSWLYSYQCSSALLTNYVPVLVISYLVSGLILPAIVTVYSLQSRHFIQSSTPAILYHTVLEGSIYDYKCKSDACLVTPEDGQSATLKSQGVKPLINSHDVISKLILNLAVMLTFGFAAPLLAVIIAVDSCSAALTWRLLINRFMLLNRVQSTDGLNKTLNPQSQVRLEAATMDCFAGLYSCWLLALVSVAFFWGVFVFDMVGDVYGPEAGGLSVIAPSLILFLIGLAPAIKRRLDRSRAPKISSQESRGMELTSISPMTSTVDMNSEYL